MAFYPYSPTHHQLAEWLDLIHKVSHDWGDHMDEFWLDLPPDVCEAIYVASNAFGDAADAVEQHLNVTHDDNDDDEDEDDYV